MSHKVSLKMPWLKILISLLVVLFLGAAAVIAYFGVGPKLLQPYSGNNIPQQDVAGIVNPSLTPTPVPQTIDPATMAILLQRVGSLIKLPAQESPQVEVVTDPVQLKNQPFFAAAQTGDVVLIFAQAKLIILYRPSVDKVIQTGSLGAQASSSATR